MYENTLKMHRNICYYARKHIGYACKHVELHDNTYQNVQKRLCNTYQNLMLPLTPARLLSALSILLLWKWQPLLASPSCRWPASLLLSSGMVNSEQYI